MRLYLSLFSSDGKKIGVQCNTNKRPTRISFAIFSPRIAEVTLSLYIFTLFQFGISKCSEELEREKETDIKKESNELIDLT